MQFFIDKGSAIALWLLALAAQVSGYTSTAISLGLVGLAVFFLLPPIVHHGRAWQKRFRARAATKARSRNFRMIPIILLWIGALILLSGATWAFLDFKSSQADVLTALRRYVLPRQLSEKQIATIKGYLLEHEPQEYKFGIIKNNEEAGIFRTDLQKALTEGGWKVIGFDYPSDIPQGIRIQLNTIPDLPPRKERADEILKEAFRRAKVRIDGSGSGGNGPYLLTIQIGERRRDDGVIRARQNQSEMIRRINEDYLYDDQE